MDGLGEGNGEVAYVPGGGVGEIDASPVARSIMESEEFETGSEELDSKDIVPLILRDCGGAFKLSFAIGRVDVGTPCTPAVSLSRRLERRLDIDRTSLGGSRYPSEDRRGIPVTGSPNFGRPSARFDVRNAEAGTGGGGMSFATLDLLEFVTVEGPVDKLPDIRRRMLATRFLKVPSFPSSVGALLFRNFRVEDAFESRLSRLMSKLFPVASA